MHLISVDLPAPLSPTMAWTSPSRSSNDAPRSATTRPNCFSIASARRTAAASLTARASRVGGAESIDWHLTAGALEHDDRDLALGLVHVVVVRRPDLGHRRPETVALVAAGCARPCGELLVLDLQLHLGMLDEVPVPPGVLRRAALRGDDDVAVAVAAEDERRRAGVARAATGRRQQQDRHAVPDVADLAVGLP